MAQSHLRLPTVIEQTGHRRGTPYLGIEQGTSTARPRLSQPSVPLLTALQLEVGRSWREFARRHLSVIVNA
jgi:hypothetical protein